MSAPSGGADAGDAPSRERERERERLERLRTLEDQIGEALRESQARGELQRAPSWGKALRRDDGFDETPLEWRMPMKILKDAGVAPPEVEMMREIADLQRRAEATTSDAEREALQRRIADKRQHLALRLERFRAGHGE